MRGDERGGQARGRCQHCDAATCHRYGRHNGGTDPSSGLVRRLRPPQLRSIADATSVRSRYSHTWLSVSGPDSFSHLFPHSRRSRVDDSSKASALRRRSTADDVADCASRHGAFDGATSGSDQEVGDEVQTEIEVREIGDPRRLVELTGWNRDYCRASLRSAGTLKIARPRTARSPKYGPHLIACLTMCWTFTRTPAGKRLAPLLATVVPLCRRDGDITMTDVGAALLVSMSAATIDRHLAPEQAKLSPRGRSHTKPGTLR